MTLLDHALAVAATGLPVFPCQPSNKRPLTKNGFYDAATDPEQIKRWWREHPRALIGVPTGERSGFFVVDLDGVEHGGPCGLAAWDKLTASHAAPPTRKHETPHGGIHLFFRYDPQRPVGNRRGDLPAGIDIRGTGGYIIWPASRLPDGRAWRVPENCETDAIADAPEWLYQLIAEKLAAKGAGGKPYSHFWRSKDHDYPCSPSGEERRDDSDGRIYAWVVTPEGTGHFVPRDELVPAYGGAGGAANGNGAYAEAALANELAAVARAKRGARNETLNRAAFSLGQFVGAGALSGLEVEERLYGAAQASGLIADDGERAVRATIESDLNGGMKQPREIPERNNNGPPPEPPPGLNPPPPPPNGKERPPPVLEVLDVGDDDKPIRPRQWLLGTVFCREFVSGLIAPGAGAKTSLRIAQALSLACGRPLTGEHVFVQCNVLFVCLEDGRTEARRKVRAAMIHHDVSREEVKGRFFLTTPTRMKMAQYGDRNAVVPGDLDAAIRAFVAEKKIDLVIFDPVKKAHAVEENSNDEMDAVVSILTALAIEKNIGVDIASHERKSGQPSAGDVNRARGAGAMKDGGRLMYTNTWMTEDEAKTFGVSEDERRLLFRVDPAKVNLAPPSATAHWFKLVGVRLDNGDATYPNGDEVQTVERWTPPALFQAFSTPDLNKALDKLRMGMDDGRRYSAAPSAKMRAAWRVLHEIRPDQSEERCRQVIKTWAKNGVLTIGPYYDEKERKENEGIIDAKMVGVEVAP